MRGACLGRPLVNFLGGEEKRHKRVWAKRERGAVQDSCTPAKLHRQSRVCQRYAGSLLPDLLTKFDRAGNQPLNGKLHPTLSRSTNEREGAQGEPHTHTVASDTSVTSLMNTSIR